MKNEIIDYREKLSRYNQWEDKRRSTLTKSHKLQEFLVLFDLAEHMHLDEIKKYQKLHLENLVETQARLRSGQYREGKRYKV